DAYVLAVALALARTAAASAVPRLSWFIGGVPRYHRAADRPPRARRGWGRCVPPGHPVHSRLRLLRPHPRDWLEFLPDRQRLGGADEAPPLRALRRAGRGHRRIDLPPSGRDAF